MIRFNKTYLSGNELKYIKQSVESGEISGNKFFTRKCHDFFIDKYGFENVFLTTSCTAALEMSAILIGIKEGDEIIVPSYTFVSTANAFILRGAKIVFADSEKNNPNIDVSKIEGLITKRTKAIVPVHYAGVACDMDSIMKIADKYSLHVIEDAAQAIDSYYKNKPLGSIGHFGVFSFHDSKNISSGEGGLLVVNDKEFKNRAEIIWEKGTNRIDFSRGNVDKYTWVDIGSSFLLSDINSAYLYAQLEGLDKTQKIRKKIWNKYFFELKILSDKKFIKLPYVPDYATNNAHIFYLICRSEKERNGLIDFLKKNGVLAVFHYLSLHNSPYFKDKHDGRLLPMSEKHTKCLVRLPLHCNLSNRDLEFIIKLVKKYFYEQV